MKSYGIKDFRATVFYDGRIQQTFATTIAVPCNLNPVNTPFDEQSCVLRYGSWTFNKDEIDLQLISEFEDTSELQKQVLWQVTKIKAVRVETYDQPVGWVAEINYSINLKRKPYYFLRKILEPTIIIAFVGTFAFLLPVQSGEKIMLVINTLHALTLYQTVLAENTPRSSKEMPKLSKYHIFSVSSFRLLFRYLSGIGGLFMFLLSVYSSVLLSFSCPLTFNIRLRFIMIIALPLTLKVNLNRYLSFHRYSLIMSS